MNPKIFTYNPKNLIFALLAVSTIGLVASPAKADEALIQETIQESVTTGSDNVSVQNSRQLNQQSSEYRNRYGYENNGNTGIVQRSEQFCDQYGEYNTCVQNAQQRNITNTRRIRSHRR